MNISLNTVLSALFVYAPQFYTTDPVILGNYANLYTLILGQVNTQLLTCAGVSVFAFLMAHYLTIAANPNIGVLNNIAEGDLSLGYNVASDMNALELTPYGRSYLDLVKRTIVGPFVTNLPVVFGGVNLNMPVGCGCNSGAGWGYGNAGDGCGCGGC